MSTRVTDREGLVLDLLGAVVIALVCYFGLI